MSYANRLLGGDVSAHGPAPVQDASHHPFVAARITAARVPPARQDRGVGDRLAVGDQRDRGGQRTEADDRCAGWHHCCHGGSGQDDERLAHASPPLVAVLAVELLGFPACWSRARVPRDRFLAAAARGFIPTQASSERQRTVKGHPMSKVRALEPGRKGSNDPLDTPTDLSDEAVRDIAEAVNGVLADSFALYLKTKNFHWHVSGPHFRDYHLLLDEQGEQIFATTDELAERVRKIGGRTLRSIGHIAKLQRIRDNDADFVDPADMLMELMRDNKAIVHSMREAHEIASKHDDSATTSILENFIDEAERRVWFLFEASRAADQSGH